MYNETITLFNRLGNRKEGDKWYPHVLRNCCVYRDRAAVVAQMGENSTDNVSIHIIITKGCKASGYRYLQPIEWERGNDYSGAFTVKGGNDFDMIWVGTWPTADVVDDSTYTEGFLHYMQLNYDNVYSVSSCSDYSRSILPHLEVIGR